jgi:hypothetical protein
MVPSFRVVTAWAGEEVNNKPLTNHRQTKTIPNPFFIIFSSFFYDFLTSLKAKALSYSRIRTCKFVLQGGSGETTS